MRALDQRRPAADARGRTQMRPAGAYLALRPRHMAMVHAAMMWRKRRGGGIGCLLPFASSRPRDRE